MELNSQELSSHKDALGILAEGRIPKREINIALWARVISDKRGISYDKAYAMALGAGRALASAGYGRYIEGRRGRESRFKATKDVKELASQLAGSSPAVVYAAPVAGAPQLTAQEIAALRGLLENKSKDTAGAPPPKSLEDHSVEELMQALNKKIAKS